MTCPHVTVVKPVPPGAEGYEECLQIGSQWVHLRLCLTVVMWCCDSSPNRHGTKHFHMTEDPAIASFEPGERWAWCYVEKRCWMRPAGRTGLAGGNKA